ncbi:hypothetical protein ACFQ98_18545, partial [Bacillus safensis]
VQELAKKTEEDMIKFSNLLSKSL